MDSGFGFWIVDHIRNDVNHAGQNVFAQHSHHFWCDPDANADTNANAAMRGETSRLEIGQSVFCKEYFFAVRVVSVARIFIW